MLVIAKEVSSGSRKSSTPPTVVSYAGVALLGCAMSVHHVAQTLCMLAQPLTAIQGDLMFPSLLPLHVGTRLRSAVKVSFSPVCACEKTTVILPNLPSNL